MTTPKTSRAVPVQPDLNRLDAAAYRGVSVSTIDRLIRSGELPARRIGKRAVRVRQADLDALGTPLGPKA